MSTIGGEKEAPILDTHPTIEEGEIGEEIIEEVMRVVEMAVMEVHEPPPAFEVVLHQPITIIPSSSGLPTPTKSLAEVLATEEPFALALVEGTISYGTAHTYIPCVLGHTTNTHSGASLVGVSTKPVIHNGRLVNMPKHLYNISQA